MKVETLLISIALFSLVITVLMGAVGNLAVEYTDMGYPQNVDTESTAIFDKAEGINNITASLQERLSTMPSNPLSVINSFLYSAWSALLLSLKSLTMATSIIAAAGSTFGIPPVITGFIIVAITLSLIFTLIYIAFNRGGFA